MILVSGATGHVGRAVVCRLASLGHDVRRVRYRPRSIDKYLTWASARLNDPGPYAFSTLCASIAERRYNQVSKDFTAIRAENQRAFEISFFGQRPGVRQIA